MQTILRLSLILILLAAFSNIAAAATVHGNIYDLSLNKVSGAKLMVNTTPNQNLISKDGSYTFNIPNGFYTIKAEFHDNGNIEFEKKNITINQEGNYVIDFILFPSFEEEEDISQNLEIAFPETEENNFVSLLVVILIFILGIVVFFIFKGKKEKEGKSGDETNKEDDEDKDINDIIDIIKKEGGRTTQKEIRKHFPLSEAKISLMIAELEHKGIIQKIKKGRGNIILLKKK